VNRGAALERLLAPNITWTVPGDNRIAGTYRGLEESVRLRHDVLAGDGGRIAALTDGIATIRDAEHRWSTVGLYEVAGGQIAACWLLPLDQRVFDAIWGR
jgi:uncharacterized protein